MPCYELKHISDLLDVPAERRNAMLDEMKIALPFFNAQLIAALANNPNTTPQDIMPRIIWEDNGELTVTARFGSGAVAMLLDKSAPTAKVTHVSVDSIKPLLQVGDKVLLVDSDEWETSRHVTNVYDTNSLDPLYYVEDKYYTRKDLQYIATDFEYTAEPRVGDLVRPRAVMGLNINRHVVATSNYPGDGRVVFELEDGSVYCATDLYVVERCDDYAITDDDTIEAFLQVGDLVQRSDSPNPVSQLIASVLSSATGGPTRYVLADGSTWYAQELERAVRPVTDETGPPCVGDLVIHARWTKAKPVVLITDEKVPLYKVGDNYYHADELVVGRRAADVTKAVVDLDPPRVGDVVQMHHKMWAYAQRVTEIAGDPPQYRVDSGKSYSAEELNVLERAPT